MSRGSDVEGGTADGVTSTVAGRTSSVGPVSNVNHGHRQSYLELGALPSAVPSARMHARLVVGEWGLSDLVDDIELVVSELVTNAVQASRGLDGCRWRGQWVPGPPPVRLWLQADRTTVLIQVWDGSERMPERQKPGSHEDGGRGLLIVEALCQRYGAYVLEGCSGKVVWGKIAG